MATYEHATWRMHVSVRTCVLRVCAHVCASVIIEIKLPFKDNHVSL